MTVAGKEVLQGHYGRGAQYAYFSGCSTGGSQALHEAQQFPADYDGILAGAPANNRTHLHTDVLWNYDVTHRTPDSLIPPDKLQLMTRAVLGACAAQSGGLPSDPYLTDPRACRWDPAEIQCAEGANDTSQCLTPAQVEAARLVYDGPRNPRTGRLIYAGPERGSESGSTFDWARLQGITVPSDIPLFSGLFYWAFGPDWDWRTFDYDRDMALLDDLLAAILNANDPDLDRFRERGGKLIGYHGWADALVPPQDFVSYYERVAARDSGRGGPQLASALPAGGEPVSTIIQGPDTTAAEEDDGGTQNSGGRTARTRDYFRLFLAPGVGHCSGGPGPNQFGNVQPAAVPANPENNLLLALRRWVEEGVAPRSVVATKFVNDAPASGVAATRPLCPVPARFALPRPRRPERRRQLRLRRRRPLRQPDAGAGVLALGARPARKESDAARHQPPAPRPAGVGAGPPRRAGRLRAGRPARAARRGGAALAPAAGRGARPPARGAARRSDPPARRDGRAARGGRAQPGRSGARGARRARGRSAAGPRRPGGGQPAGRRHRGGVLRRALRPLPAHGAGDGRAAAARRRRAPGAEGPARPRPE
jgi:hypothetical protein